MRSRGLSDSSLRRIAEFQGSISKVAQEEGHQGFKNYETFSIALWIANDRDDYEYWRDRASELAPLEGPPIDLADTLEEYYESGAPEVDGVYSSLLSSALEKVDWLEVAENLLEE